MRIFCNWFLVLSTNFLTEETLCRPLGSRPGESLWKRLRAEPYQRPHRSLLGGCDAEVNSKLKRWADTVVGPMRKAGFKKLAQLSLNDELAWHYPGFWEDTNAVVGKPRLVERYKEYLINNSGFATPQDFGADSWKAVVPAPAHVAANRKHPTVNGTLTARRAFYWSIRFGTWDTETWFARATAALVAANDGESFQIYTNWK